jgi:phage-related holin
VELAESLHDQQQDQQQQDHDQHHDQNRNFLKLKSYINSTLQGDMKSIAIEVLCLNFKKHVLLITLVGGFSIGAFTGFVEDWIFSPAASLFALLALIAADHVTGLVVAWKRDAVDTRKALSIFWKLLSHVGLLMFANNLAKGSVFLGWLNEGIFVPIVLVNMLSLIKNLSLLGYIKKDFAQWINKKVDTYKNESISNHTDNSNTTIPQ